MVSPGTPYLTPFGPIFGPLDAHDAPDPSSWDTPYLLYLGLVLSTLGQHILGPSPTPDPEDPKYLNPSIYPKLTYLTGLGPHPRDPEMVHKPPTISAIWMGA